MSPSETIATLRHDVRRWFARRAESQWVDDLTQEALTRMLASELRDQERIHAWMYRVSHSVLVDHYRRTRPHDALDPSLTAEAEGFDDQATSKVASWLPAMIAGLEEPYREALTLTELQGVSQHELAQRLGISPSGARSRVQRGRKALKAALDDCCAVRFEGGEVVDVRANQCGCEPTHG